MYKEIKKEDLFLVNDMLSKINISAKDIFNQSYENGNLIKGLVYNGQDNKGVFTIIDGDNYFSVQISFDKDVISYKFLKIIQDELENIIRVRGAKDIYLNFNGYNSSMINYFRDYGFIQDSLGFEYSFSALSEEAKEISNFNISDNLIIKRFEEENALKYLELLDDSFRILQIECNEEQDVFRKKTEENISWLRKSSDNDNFGAVWDGDKLIGVYILYKNYIDTIAVHPKYQSKGYGNQIIKHCLKNMIHEKKHEEVYLHVLFQNRKAQKLYMKNGFTVRGFYCENTYQP